MIALTVFVINLQDRIVSVDKTRKPIIGLKLYPAGLEPTTTSPTAAKTFNTPLSTATALNRSAKGEIYNSKSSGVKFLSKTLRAANETQTESTKDKNITISTTVSTTVSF